MSASPTRARADVADPYDSRLALGATGLLRGFNKAGVLAAADVHVARRLGGLGEETDEGVLLAAALAVRAVRHGSVCVALSTVSSTVQPEEPLDPAADRRLEWPEPAGWLAACAGSPLVAVGDAGDEPVTGRPLRLVGDLLYLDRYWRQEQLVRRELDARSTRSFEPADPAALRDALAGQFSTPAPDLQRLAAAMSALRSVTVIAGGPGTGKTFTVDKVLELIRSQQDGQQGEPRVALAAPTGKAAARLEEAVGAEAKTLHRLLGRSPDSRSRFRHNRENRLPYDVVVVDETSMVSLTLMARLLEAMRPDARLVLVGDPNQLASVEAGAVLGDLVERPTPAGSEIPALLRDLAGPDMEAADDESLRRGVVHLTRPYRYGPEIGELAAAVQDANADRVLDVLRSEQEAVSFVDSADEHVAYGLGGLRTDVVDAARELSEAARVGDATVAVSQLNRHRLLCAHRRGPFGVERWSDEVERWTADALGRPSRDGEWYVGRPVLVTANDYEVEVFNGDTGVVIDGGERGPVVAFTRGKEPWLVSPHRLSSVQTVHAMTVHRAQGSQFERVTLLLPSADSPVLTRELFYTAITRAEKRVRVIGTEDAVRAAVSRPIVRASGLRR